MKKVKAFVVVAFGVILVLTSGVTPAKALGNGNSGEKDFVNWLVSGDSESLYVTEIGTMANLDSITWEGTEHVQSAVNADNFLFTRQLRQNSAGENVLYRRNSQNRAVSETSCSNTNYRVIWRQAYDSTTLYACFHGVGKNSNYTSASPSGQSVIALCPGMTEGHILYHLQPEIWSTIWGLRGANLPRDGDHCHDFDSQVQFIGIEITKDQS